MGVVDSGVVVRFVVPAPSFSLACSRLVTQGLLLFLHLSCKPLESHLPVKISSTSSVGAQDGRLGAHEQD